MRERRLSRKEIAALIRESVGHPPLVLSFGPGAVWLANAPENEWALSTLLRLRGITFEDGEGI